MLFGDDFQTMPLSLMSIFKGELKRTFSSKDFLDSNNLEVLRLKHLMLKSARLAFHYSFEAYIMGDIILSEF